ncbi:AAA family ATPase [Streptomyces sp. SP18BB07]|uniref:AAA family ATPase n=1 Tax=Streptomyces sp. SP18BB07 TaxID=3002522 RepID=UPI002E765CC9|nr:ATP-binding protein [Streptomyces sp. SP18BB07]MEE1763812.1 ATP-binding protein [Streptomyces sp. SP18BB07]
MLLSFRVANHGSLREPQELNLVPVYEDERPALTVAAIYGANASGKSTVLDAYRFFLAAVEESQAQWLPDAPVERRPFLLDHDSRREPSRYAVDVLVDQVRYVYGFAVSDRSVEEEWLYSYPRGRKRVLFERRAMDVTFGTTLSGERVAAERVMRPNSLYLSAAAQNAHVELSRVWRAIKGAAVVSDDIRHAITQGGALLARVLAVFEEAGLARGADVLTAADLGVQGVRETSDEDPISKILRRHQDWENLSTDTRAAIGKKMAFVHTVGDEEFLLPAQDESAGTKTWLNLMSWALMAVHQGQQLWIDEVDVSLHPLLTAKLLKLFQSPELNPRGAQLIFTTHSATLLGTMLGEEVLRRDQIWFVEKSAETGASELYPLSDFKPRKGENFERRYLAGSYGAVPVLPDTALEDVVRAYWGAHGKAVSA